MNPSERGDEEYIILYKMREEDQPGSFYDIACYQRVRKKEDILGSILDLAKNRRAHDFQVFILGKLVKVDWK